jgi:hypothetical protein
MNFPKLKCPSGYELRCKSENNKEYIKNIKKTLNNLKFDPDKEKRLEKYECVYCFYVNSSRIGGATISFRPCVSCGKEVYSSNTCIDLFCKDCAKELELCAHCGADIRLRVRRDWNKLEEIILRKRNANDYERGN